MEPTNYPGRKRDFAALCDLLAALEPAVAALRNMEKQGFAVDPDALERLGDTIRDDLSDNFGQAWENA